MANFSNSVPCCQLIAVIPSGIPDSLLYKPSVSRELHPGSTSALYIYVVNGPLKIKMWGFV